MKRRVRWVARLKAQGFKRGSAWVKRPVGAGIYCGRAGFELQPRILQPGAVSNIDALPAPAHHHALGGIAINDEASDRQVVASAHICSGRNAEQLFIFEKGDFIRGATQFESIEHNLARSCGRVDHTKVHLAHPLITVSQPFDVILLNTVQLQAETSSAGSS